MTDIATNSTIVSPLHLRSDDDVFKSWRYLHTASQSLKDILSFRSFETLFLTTISFCIFESFIDILQTICTATGLLWAQWRRWWLLDDCYAVEVHDILDLMINAALTLPIVYFSIVALMTMIPPTFPSLLHLPCILYFREKCPLLCICIWAFWISMVFICSRTVPSEVASLFMCPNYFLGSSHTLLETSVRVTLGTLQLTCEFNGYSDELVLIIQKLLFFTQDFHTSCLSRLAWINLGDRCTRQCMRIWV